MYVLKQGFNPMTDLVHPYNEHGTGKVIEVKPFFEVENPIGCPDNKKIEEICSFGDSCDTKPNDSFSGNEIKLKERQWDSDPL